MTPATLWALAQRWYDDRLEFNWQRKPVEVRQAIFNELGLTSAFWDLGPTP